MIKFLEVRNFQVLDGIYDFDVRNKLAGHNGSGKTSLGRAIIFCYTGRDIAGSTSTDHYINNLEVFSNILCF